MANKYIKQGTTALEEVEALVSSTGAGDAGKIVALDTDGRLNISVMPTGIGADTLSVVASESLSAGNLINLWNDSGVLKARKADASGGVAKKADGHVKEAVSNGNFGTIYFGGTISGLTGLTIGSNYFLSGTAGAVTATIPTTAMHIAQYVGKAISATELSFEPGEPVVRA